MAGLNVLFIISCKLVSPRGVWSGNLREAGGRRPPHVFIYFLGERRRQRHILIILETGMNQSPISTPHVPVNQNVRKP